MVVAVAVRVGTPLVSTVQVYLVTRPPAEEIHRTPLVVGLVPDPEGSFWMAMPWGSGEGGNACAGHDGMAGAHQVVDLEGAVGSTKVKTRPSHRW